MKRGFLIIVVLLFAAVAFAGAPFTVTLTVGAAGSDYTGNFTLPCKPKDGSVTAFIPSSDTGAPVVTVQTTNSDNTARYWGHSTGWGTVTAATVTHANSDKSYVLTGFTGGPVIYRLSVADNTLMNETIKLMGECE